MHLPWPLRPFFFVQDFLGGLYAAIGILFYWIMPYSHSHSLSVLLAFLGGLYVAIGMLFYWIMPYSHSHSLSVLWAFLGGLYVAIGMLFYWIMLSQPGSGHPRLAPDSPLGPDVYSDLHLGLRTLRLS